MNYKRRRPKSHSRACQCGGKSYKRDGNTLTPLEKPAPEEPRPWPGRKDTRRWCGGKVGREHHPHWQPVRWGFRSESMEYVCSVCKKRLDYCSHWGWKKKGCRCGYHGAKGVG